MSSCPRDHRALSMSARPESLRSDIEAVFAPRAGSRGGTPRGSAPAFLGRNVDPNALLRWSKLNLAESIELPE